MAYAIIETEAIAAALAAIVSTIDPGGRSARRASQTIRSLADEYDEPDASAFLYLLADTMEYSVPGSVNNSVRVNG